MINKIEELFSIRFNEEQRKYILDKSFSGSVTTNDKIECIRASLRYTILDTRYLNDYVITYSPINIFREQFLSVRKILFDNGFKVCSIIL